MDEIKQNILYLLLLATFAFAFYFPIQKVALCTLPLFSVWIMWKQLRLWPYSFLLMVFFALLVYSRGIYAFSFKTLKRPLWTLVVRFYFSALITAFYGSWFFSMAVPYYLLGKNNIIKRYFLLALCFATVFIITDIFIFYLLAPAMARKKVEQRGRLTNYGKVLCFEEARQNCLAKKTKIINKTAREIMGAKGRLRCVKVARPCNKSHTKSFVPLCVPVMQAFVIKFINSKTGFKVAPSQMKNHRNKVGVVYSYEKCTTIFGLEYIKNIKELGSPKKGKASRWDIYRYP